jgi:hypothetical protein
MKQLKSAFVSLQSVLVWLWRLLALAAWDRERTRREQLSVVAVGHLGIFVVGLLVVSVFQLSSGIPVVFLVGELFILVISTPFVVSLPGLQDYFRLPEGLPGERPDSDDESATRKTAKKEEWAGRVLIWASIVQFAALAALLWETGGPLESPFAEMTLMIAVFTPFIANKPKTIGFVVVAVIVYYAILIWLYSKAHPNPVTVEEFEAILPVDDPSVWAYFLVNVLILLGATALTIFESFVHSLERRGGSDGGDHGKSWGDGKDGGGNGGLGGGTGADGHQPKRAADDEGGDPISVVEPD